MSFTQILFLSFSSKIQYYYSAIWFSLFGFFYYLSVEIEIIPELTMRLEKTIPWFDFAMNFEYPKCGFLMLFSDDILGYFFISYCLFVCLGSHSLQFYQSKVCVSGILKLILLECGISKSLLIKKLPTEKMGDLILKFTLRKYRVQISFMSREGKIIGAVIFFKLKTPNRIPLVI